MITRTIYCQGLRRMVFAMKKLFNCNPTDGHALYMAFVVVILLTLTVACGHKGAEMEEIDKYVQKEQEAEKKGDFQKSLQLRKQLYDTSQKGHSTLFRIKAASNYAQILILTGQPDEGKRIADEAMSLTSGLTDDPVMGDLYTAYGLYEMTKGQNIYAATEYFLKVIGYARQLNDKAALAGALSNLVSSMTNQQDTTGLQYALESYQLAKEAGDTIPQTFALINLVVQNRFKKDYAEAAKWLQVLRETAGPTFVAVTINTLQADLCREINDYVKAHHYIDLAIAMADTSHTLQPMERENAYLGKANILNQQGLYAESNQWLDKLEDISKQTQVSIPKAEVAKIYADNYEHLGNYQKALEFRKSQIKIKRDNTNSDRIKIQKAKEVALDLAQKDAEIKQHQANARMLKLTLWGTLGFIAFLMALCFYIYNMYKRQRKLMTVVVERAQSEEVIEEQREKQTDNKHVELFRQIKEEVDDKKMFLDVSLSRESLAKHLGTNRTYISEAVAQMTGMNFPQYINLLRINEAERRLHNPQIDVSNFANFGRTLGFASLNAFRTAFKQQTGMTLSAYREIARKRPTPALPG